jgi:hypothetical protein
MKRKNIGFSPRQKEMIQEIQEHFGFNSSYAAVSSCILHVYMSIPKQNYKLTQEKEDETKNDNFSKGNE